MVPTDRFEEQVPFPVGSNMTSIQVRAHDIISDSNPYSNEMVDALNNNNDG